MPNDRYAELGHLVADLIDHGRHILQGTAAAAPSASAAAGPALPNQPSWSRSSSPAPHLACPACRGSSTTRTSPRILSGQQFIDIVPRQIRRGIADKHITRLVKSETGDPVFETIDSEDDVIKLAGRYGSFDAVEEFGIDKDRDLALDPDTRLAIGAGLDALRDAGVPLVRSYHTTTLGTQLPGPWRLPDELRDETGVIFASAFPALDSFVDDVNHYQEDRARRHELATLEDVRARMSAADPAVAEVDRRIADLRHAIESQPFQFDRRFLFRALPMAHAQFAEVIGARGPNTQLNAACASTAQALNIARGLDHGGPLQARGRDLG